ncbi:MAG: hypothetical protein ICV68_12950 [Pyrinomonadaceae bacterium]|nr:hypothetical protein [Pyrinomonadaceae bacterium]
MALGRAGLVAVIDAASYSIIKTIPVGKRVWGWRLPRTARKFIRPTDYLTTCL